jgi:NRAMP (natural resistance-associated macrophage protein)-like metal ion transporter
MFWLSKTFHGLNRFRKKAIIFLSVLGPGIIVMIADNDAGGISTYAVSGSKYGFSLLWIFLILFPMAYFVQEMTVRVGAVTKRGQAEMIFEGFGSFWGWFSIVDLIIINWLTLVTEYVGMTAAMSLFGVPPWITFIAVTAILFTVVRTGQYWTFEKITLFFCCFNFVYIPAAIWAMDTPTAPAWNQVFQGFYRPDMGGFNMDLVFIILAILGTTITPWQLFFQQSAVVDKGLDIHDVKFGKMETMVGSFLTCLVAVFIIIATGAAFYYHSPPITIQDARQTAEAIVPLMPAGYGDLARKLFAIGLFDAGFLGALCISLATSWAVGEVFGWAHSLNQKVKDAPWFYLIYLLMLLTSGAVVLIPEAPLVTITMFVQVVAVTLLPVSLVFLLLVLNDPAFMGEHVNTPFQNVMNWGIVIFVILMSSIMGLGTLFPGWFT